LLQFIASSARYPEFRCLNAHQRNRVLKKKLGFSSAQPIWLGAAGIGNRFSLPRLLQFIASSARYPEFRCLNVLRRNRVLKKKTRFLIGTANLARDGGDWKSLFITASTSIYRVECKVSGIPVP
ncbi:MAG: hypothetical protein OXP71_04350, partial [Candidatus Poribacteria bacterium]|nr:hypothetical protein [Candidatus Poribacteria bacterium]